MSELARLLRLKSRWRSSLPLLQSQIAAIAAQGLGGVQLYLLVIVHVENQWSDIYTLSFAILQAPIAILCIGVLLPFALRNPWYGDWRSWYVRLLGPTALAIVGTLGYLEILGYRSGAVVKVILALLPAALIAPIVNLEAVRLVCLGRGLALAAATLLPNLAAVIALSFELHHSTAAAVLAMCIALSVGNAAMLAAYVKWRRKVVADVETPQGDREPPERGFVSALLVSAVVGYLGPIALQSGAAVLPNGRVTAFGAVTKVGLAVVGVSVNALLAVVVNWRLQRIRGLRLMTATIATLTLLATLTATAAAPRDVNYALVIAWVGLSAAAAVSLRAANVTAPSYRRLVLAISVSSLAVFSAGTLSFVTSRLDVAYFATLATVSGVQLVLCCRSLRWGGCLMVGLLGTALSDGLAALNAASLHHELLLAGGLSVAGLGCAMTSSRRMRRADHFADLGLPTKPSRSLEPAGQPGGAP